ncbi:MAG: putative sulfate exporter family transporter [Planctomycetota bacterium]
MPTVSPPVLTPKHTRYSTAKSNALSPPLSNEAFWSLACMEGVYDPVVTPTQLPRRQPGSLRSGYLFAGMLAAGAYLLHHLPMEPFSVPSPTGVRHPISAAIIAIVSGLLVGNLLTLPTGIRSGCKHIVKKMIPVAIVCTGAGLNLGTMAKLGPITLAITVFSLVIGLLGSYGISRLLGLGSRVSMLLGAGTGICGNSAIVAVAPLIDAKERDVVLSIAVVNLFGLAAMFAWPVLGRQFELAPDAFGIWCGTSIHAVPQVVAAGFAYGPDAGAVATLVKLVRVTLLAPLVFVLALIHSKHTTESESSSRALSVHYARLVPWFVWGFLALATLNTLGLIPALQFPTRGFWSWAATESATINLGTMLTTLGELLLTLAMVAIGLDVNLKEIGGVGGRAVVAGLLSTATLGAASLILITWLV